VFVGVGVGVMCLQRIEWLLGCNNQCCAPDA